MKYRYKDIYLEETIEEIFPELNNSNTDMKISIVTWSENYYDDYIQISLNENKIIYRGLIVEIFDEQNKTLQLNYGGNNFSKVYLKKYKENFYCIPDEDTMYSSDYIFIPLKFMKYQLEKMWINDSELNKILEIDIKDIMNEWILTSKFKNNCFNLDEYKYELIKNILFVDNDKINKNIKNMFNTILSLEKREIIDISNLNLKPIEVYLDSGIVWNAFLKNGKDIYLNTGLDISIKVF